MNLEPIAPPGSVAFWPLQPGWYVVIVLLLILAGYGIYKYAQFKRRNAYRKRALLELDKLTSKTFDQSLVSELNTLLKVTALKGYPRTLVAELAGTDWLEFLESTEPKLIFSKSPGTYLASSSFMPSSEIDISNIDWNNLIQMSKSWIKFHKHI